MKKFIAAVSTLFLMVGILIFPNATLWAAGLGMSVSAQSVNVGDTVTATVSVPSGYGATVALSYDSSVLEVTSSTGNGALLNLGDAMGQPASGTVTFKAVGAGSCTISAASTVAGDANGDAVNLDGASASVTVANAVTEPPADNQPAGGNEGTQEPVLSADNSLASLVLSEGELSPAFSYGTTKYTATVGYDVTNIAISAKTSNSKAQIVSVSGNENLAVGENTIKIVVKAENGVTATYVITVTRSAQDGTGNTPADDDNQPDSQYTNEFVINGATLTPAEVIPDDVVPADFTASTIELSGVEYPCLQYNNGAVTLLYFVEEDAQSGALYVYEQSTQSVYPYIRLNSESGYILVLVPAQEQVDESWQEISLTLEGKGIADAFRSVQLPEDFYYLYAMNQAGEQGWYLYDSIEGTYLRYVPAAEEEPVTEDSINAEEYEHLKAGYQQLSDELEQTNQRNRLYIGILAGVIVILFIGIVILFVLSRRGHLEDADDALWDDEADAEDELVDDEADVEDEPVDGDADAGDEPVSETADSDAEPLDGKIRAEDEEADTSDANSNFYRGIASGADFEVEDFSEVPEAEDRKEELPEASQKAAEEDTKEAVAELAKAQADAMDLEEALEKMEKSGDKDEDLEFIEL